MGNNYTVYCHENKINNKKYFGITKQEPAKRWGANGKNYKNDTPYFWNAIEKYGWDNFEHIIIEQNLTKEEACQKEIDLIKENKTQDRNYGYNILEGGQAPQIPKEVREKMSKSMQGNKNGWGYPCSEEKKKKISDAQKGRKFSNEHKEKISRAKAGKKGKPCSEEKKKKISQSHKKSPVYCLETNTVYESIQECAKQLKLIPTLVCKCCKKKIKTTGGYHLEYYINT